LRTPKEKEDFKAHLRRYMSVYLPDCPFEVTTTNRYTIFSAEASVTARRYIRRNETIKYLSGIQVIITPEEEEEMSLRNKDFSLVVSSRSKATSLFMGPARFANHDCNANARLVTRGQAAIEIIACRDIEIDEEITVSYSESYFGEDNCECLCHTCEKSKVNGWKPDDSIPSVQKSIEVDVVQGYALRRRRRDDSVTGAGSRAPSVTPDIRPRVLKRQRSQRMLGDRATSFDSMGADGPGSSTAFPTKRKLDLSALTPPVTPAKRQKTTHYKVEPLPMGSVSSRESSEPALSLASVLSEANSGNITEVTSPEVESPQPLVMSPDPTPAKQEAQNVQCEETASEIEVRGIPEAISMATEATLSAVSVVLTTVKTAEPGTDDGTVPVSEVAPPRISLAAAADSIATTGRLPQPTDYPVVDSTISTPTAEDETDTAGNNQTPTKAPARGRKRTAAVTPRSSSKSVPRGRSTSRASSLAPSKKCRVPGDYTLTPVLLAKPDSAWISCTICSAAFVQEDAYFTKVSCPRCERHSKLYGYPWPKTQPAGPGDEKNRVLDHRLIHRFLDPEDEAKIRGRKHWKDRLGGGKESTQEPEERGRPTARDDSEEGGASGLRRSGRARRATAKVVGE